MPVWTRGIRVFGPAPDMDTPLGAGHKATRPGRRPQGLVAGHKAREESPEKSLVLCPAPSGLAIHGLRPMFFPWPYITPNGPLEVETWRIVFPWPDDVNILLFKS